MMIRGSNNHWWHRVVFWWMLFSDNLIVNSFMPFCLHLYVWYILGLTTMISPVNFWLSHLCQSPYYCEPGRWNWVATVDDVGTTYTLPWPFPFQLMFCFFVSHAISCTTKLSPCGLSSMALQFLLCTYLLASLLWQFSMQSV